MNEELSLLKNLTSAKKLDRVTKSRLVEVKLPVSLSAGDVVKVLQLFEQTKDLGTDD